MADSQSIVLVHGAWHGPWVWDQVVGPLRERGFDVRTVQHPSSDPGRGTLGDMYADAESLRRELGSIDGDVLVVAHSYGGVVTTEGAAGADNVKHIVYLTAFMLDEGESLFSAVGGTVPDWWIRHEDAGTVEAGRAEQIFYNDCPADDAAAAAAKLEPQLEESFMQPLRSVAWREVPTTYVICDQDNAIPVFAQEHMAQRAGDVRRLDASHSPFLSMPDRVVEIIAELAG
jgi:pimeloyl-ACP methyl ester carboxylesterase